MACYITWLGHSAFTITDGDVSILIDPFIDGNCKCPIASKDIDSVDLVLVTHDHSDHSGQAIDICLTHKAHLGAVVETAGKFMAQGLPSELVLGSIGFGVGGTLQHKGIQITMVPAVHTSGSGIAVGYIVRMPSGLSIYHAGDTAIFSDMALWASLYPIDVALLPIGGIFTMDAKQAATATKLLKTPIVVPMHWGTFPTLAQDTKEFEQEVAQSAPDCKCIVMIPGEKVTF